MTSRPGVVFISLAFASTASSHHSQAEFDNTNTIEMTGEITAAYWRNPHVNFTFRADDGTQYEMETSAWNNLSRRGMPRDAVEAGDRVTVAVYRSTKRPNQLHVNNILREDGVELVFGGAGPSGARWSEQILGGMGMGAGPLASASNADGPGDLFQIWSVAGGRRVPLDRELPLTDAARAQQAAWNPITEDPLLQCIPPGMPPTMGNPYPMQFTEQDGNIVLHLEEFDNVRTIHMQPNEAENVPGPLGYSLGRWEDGSLIIETSNIDYPYFNRVGVAQSTAVTTTERFTLNEDDRRLDYELTITDPSILTEPVTWSTYYVSGRGEVIRPYECTVERYVPR
ncbi:MAG: DUF6152 family protein [Gammaproteobacteria bacterium]